MPKLDSRGWCEKLLPVMVTTVPPLVVPALGLIDATAGGGTKVYRSPTVMAEVPTPLVTWTSTVPAPAGATAVICVLELTAKLVGRRGAKGDAGEPAKLLPVMMTVVPPRVEPSLGLSDDTDGGSHRMVYIGRANWSGTCRLRGLVT